MLIIDVVQKGPTPEILRKLWNQMTRQCWLEMGQHWHATMREKHFTHSGATEYGYDKRQGERGSTSDRRFRSSYTGRKLRRFGHTLPLVWSGASRTLSRIRNVTATKDGSRVVLNTPTLNFRKGKLGRGKTMREEMTTVSDRERTVLAGVWEKAFEQNAEAVKEQSAKRMYQLSQRGR